MSWCTVPPACRHKRKQSTNTKSPIGIKALGSIDEECAGRAALVKIGGKE